MKYHIDKQAQYALVIVEEKILNTHLSSDLKAIFIDLESEGFQYVIMDMSHINYSDSSGLSALIAGNRRFSSLGAFVICGLNDHVEKLIIISQLDKILDIVPTREEAAESVILTVLEKKLQNES